MKIMTSTLAVALVTLTVASGTNSVTATKFERESLSPREQMLFENFRTKAGEVRTNEWSQIQALLPSGSLLNPYSNSRVQELDERLLTTSVLIGLLGPPDGQYKNTLTYSLGWVEGSRHSILFMTETGVVKHAAQRVQNP